MLMKKILFLVAAIAVLVGCNSNENASRPSSPEAVKNLKEIQAKRGHQGD
jgi:uncharacterized lipoprotein YajG